MQISENQIQRFFDQQCSAEEALTVASYLQEHPDLIVQWLGPDWKQAGKEIPVPASYREEMLRRITKEIRFKKQIEYKPVIQMIVSIAAVLILVVTGWWFFKNEYTGIKQPISVIKTQPNSLEWRVNTTAKPLEILLPDHSVATISPGTKLQFEKNFSGTERKVLLTGTGFFEVKKNAEKPFIVASGQITTTALGTSFRVEEHKDGVTVKLYTGKVVINKIGSIKNWSGPVYLLPGTAMTFSVTENKTTVFGFIPEQVEETIIAKRGAIEKISSVASEEMHFDNAPLEQVLKAIEKRYAVIIGYDQQHISGRYFTGKVLPTDSVAVILRVIGNINDLTIRKEADDRFSVIKNQ
ncbi:MAG: FecR family protein [Chitinophagaceae bacterium]|nr:FecR family protein [Chitinophagaceae bacterium]